MFTLSKNPKNKGFTLIELLVVIAIVGVLATIVMSSLSSARAKSRDARRIADLRQLKTALESYFIDYGCAPKGGGGSTLANPCPTGDSTLTGGSCATLNSHFNNSLQVLLDGKYISSLPVDPINQTSDGKNYCYNYSRLEPSVSGWTCGGIIRTRFLYTISFSTENANERLPVSGSGGLSNYCITGDQVI